MPSSHPSAASWLLPGRSELERYRSDATKLAERYRALEEANEALRSPDKQIDDFKRERDFAMADRKISPFRPTIAPSGLTPVDPAAHEVKQ
jgi:hypothetical protein